MRANQETNSVRTMARVLEVSPSGYYAARRRPPSARAVEDAELTAKIRTLHAVSRGTYGAPRIHKDLFEEKTYVGRKRVARLMRCAGVVGVSRRRGVRTTRRGAGESAPDLVQRDFTATGPNQLWVAEMV